MFDESEVPLDVIVDLVQHIHAYEGEGAILIFLSGWEEISAVSSVNREKGVGVGWGGGGGGGGRGVGAGGGWEGSRPLAKSHT